MSKRTNEHSSRFDSMKRENDEYYDEGDDVDVSCVVSSEPLNEDAIDDDDDDKKKKKMNRKRKKICYRNCIITDDSYLKRSIRALPLELRAMICQRLPRDTKLQIVAESVKSGYKLNDFWIDTLVEAPPQPSWLMTSSSSASSSALLPIFRENLISCSKDFAKEIDVANIGREVILNFYLYGCASDDFFFEKIYRSLSRLNRHSAKYVEYLFLDGFCCVRFPLWRRVMSLICTKFVKLKYLQITVCLHNYFNNDDDDCDDKEKNMKKERRRINGYGYKDLHLTCLLIHANRRTLKKFHITVLGSGGEESLEIADYVRKSLPTFSGGGDANGNSDEPDKFKVVSFCSTGDHLYRDSLRNGGYYDEGRVTISYDMPVDENYSYTEIYGAMRNLCKDTTTTTKTTSIDRRCRYY